MVFCRLEKFLSIFNVGDGLLSTLCQYGAIGNVLDDLMNVFCGLVTQLC